MAEIIKEKRESGRLIAEALAVNILPLTSRCNVSCVFCSHHYNPPGVETLRIGPVSLEAIEGRLPLIDPGRPVIIGESVTRIIEGEPFTHPHICKILTLLRGSLPDTTIQITTNGSLLDEKMVKKLAGLGNVVLYLSLNSASMRGRAGLMRDGGAGRAIDSPRLLNKYGVPFHGSVVAMPHLTGWDDLEQTLRFLAFSGAVTIRVFLPGFTRLAPPGLRYGTDLPDKLHDLAGRLRKEINTPVTVEPAALPDLKPRVAGVMAGTPAAAAGIRSGDEIIAVGGSMVYTRVQSFRSVLAAERPCLELRRGGRVLQVTLAKKAGESSGLVMDYDLDPAVAGYIEKAAASRRARRVLVLTSELGRRVMALGLERFYEGAAELRVFAARNRFFGGTIGAAGLLTVPDIEAALGDFMSACAGWDPDMVLIPAIAFDSRGRDLTGRLYLDLQKNCGLDVEIV